MKTEQCYSCGARKGMIRFEGRGETMSVKGMERRLDNLCGWECQKCGEVIYDSESAGRYADAGDELIIAGRQMIGAEMKRIRRKLNLTQKQAVELLSGGGHNAFSRYERGELTAPRTLILLMRLLDRYPYLLSDAKVLAEGADFRGFKRVTHEAHEILTDS
ncbi:type II toxin-antitoxin system MqsA family antitoxin [Pseudomonas sp. MYb118]|uniref:type II toxin-antitoxin system MqsA family antitoxin n=1 Tax=Pseudomonas sp. MYb118 TaxID=1848720 RepID=UPI0034CF6473